MKLLFTILLFWTANANGQGWQLIGGGPITSYTGQVDSVGLVFKATKVKRVYLSPCIAGRLDTIPVFLHMADNLNYWNYYHANGTPLWKNDKSYKVDSSLIPQGGYYIQGPPVNPKFTIVNGYDVHVSDDSCNLRHLRYLDNKYKGIDTIKKFITPTFLIRTK